MKIDQKQIIIYGGIGLVIITVILIYLLTQINHEQNNYEDLEINTIEVEEQEEKQAQNIKVHIAGSVINEGVVELEEGARIIDAITAAGGTTPDANMKEVNLAYKLQDGQKIYIPNTNDENVQIIEQQGKTNNSETGLININTATQTELELLTGIGPSTAIKIIEYREQNGKFKNIEELKEVPRNRRKQIFSSRRWDNSVKFVLKTCIK